jgi:hypothetical protein
MAILESSASSSASDRDECSVLWVFETLKYSDASKSAPLLSSTAIDTRRVVASSPCSNRDNASGAGPRDSEDAMEGESSASGGW